MCECYEQNYKFKSNITTKGDGEEKLKQHRNIKESSKMLQDIPTKHCTNAEYLCNCLKKKPDSENNKIKGSRKRQMFGPIPFNEMLICLTDYSR